MSPEQYFLFRRSLSLLLGAKRPLLIILSAKPNVFPYLYMYICYSTTLILVLRASQKSLTSFLTHILLRCLTLSYLTHGPTSVDKGLTRSRNAKCFVGWLRTASKGLIWVPALFSQITLFTFTHKHYF